MKINSGDIHTDVSEGVDELVFKVDDEDQGFIFEMLRSKIYSDSIAAICREISANARDANREVMKGHIPVEIGFRKEHLLDGGSSLHVYFKDEGPGISPDRMANVFCKYAKSTKRDTDELTGGFGLGAKTPFAYADAFNIETVVDGVKYLYTAYIDESRRGKIAKLSEEKCDEPNGTTIVVPISPSDRYRFEQNIISYTSLWDVRPNYVDIEEWNDEPLPSIEDPTFVPKLKLEDGRALYLVNRIVSGVFSTGMGLIVDGMPYNLDTRQIPGYEGMSSSMLSDLTVVMRMDTSEIDLSVNRETIQYTQKTLNAVSTVMELTAKKMVSYLTSYVDESASYFEACTKAWSIFFDNEMRCPPTVPESDAAAAKTAVAWIKQYLPKGSIGQFKYKGRDVVTTNPTFKHLYFRIGYVSDGGNAMYRGTAFSFKSFSRRSIYLLDTKTKSAHRTKMAVLDMPANEVVLICKHEFKPNESLGPVQNAANEIIFNDEVAADIKALDDMEMPYKLYSSIPLPKSSRAPVGTGQPRRKITATVNLKVRELDLKVTSSDPRKMLIPKELVVDRKSGPAGEQHKTLYLVVSDMHSMPEFDRVTETFAKFIAMYYGMRVFVVSKRYAMHFADCLDVQTAISTINKPMLEKVARAMSIINAYKNAENFGMYNGVTLKDAVMLDIEFLRTAGERYKNTNLFSYMSENFISYRLPMLFDRYQVTVPSYEGDASEFMKEFKQRYPLLPGNLRYVSQRDAVELYIKLMDEYRENNENTKTK